MLQLPPALRLPQKHKPLDFLRYVSSAFCDVYRFVLIFVDFRVSGLVFVVSGLEPAKCEMCKYLPGQPFCEHANCERFAPDGEYVNHHRLCVCVWVTCDG